MLNTSYPYKTLGIHLDQYNYCIHNCFLCCREIPKIFCYWNVLQILSLIKLINEIVSTGCISKNKKSIQFIGFAIVILSDWIVIWFAWNTTLVKGCFLSWNICMLCCIVKMFICISPVVTFIPFLASSNFWMKGSMYFNK